MDLLKVGEKAPNFTSVDQDGNIISMKNYYGKKLIIFFYPKADTPGCTAEACNLRDNYKILQDEGFELLGISTDSKKKQKKFKEKYHLPFPLLADEDKEVVNAFGVWGSKTFMGRKFDGVHRITFVIDEKGIIKRVIDKVKTKTHAEQILG